jgi:serine/threonine protein kinase
MSLRPGARLGLYEVTALIGSGGMGEVYRALDTALGRQVAIKVLPDAFASDPERLARFEREAKTLAALNHSSIAQIWHAGSRRGFRQTDREARSSPFGPRMGLGLSSARIAAEN